MSKESILRAAKKPAAMRVNVEAIPQDLREHAQWVLWRWTRDKKGGKWTKPPYSAKTKRLADKTKPADWATFDEALAVYRRGGFDGLGFCFTADDPFVGIDLDDVRDTDSGEITAEAQYILDRLASYTEISPSGTGTKTIIRSSKPVANKNDHGRGVEIYSSGAYFTITGNVFGDTNAIEDRTDDVADLWSELWPMNTIDTAANGHAGRIDDRTVAVEALARLAQWRADDYQTWIRVGLILHRVDPSLLSEWDSWSQSSPKYAAGACKDKWRSFGGMRDKMLALGSLIAWARDDDPSWNPRRAAIRHSASAGGKASINGKAHEWARDEWPSPIDAAASHGLAGDLVRLIEPHTESDPGAILVQFLVAFGSVIGRKAHFTAEADRHYGNLFTCIVGKTSNGRKGTSWGHVSRLFEAVDPTWHGERVLGGLSSGEGLIWAVRDPIVKQEPVKEKNRIIGYQQVEIDAGVSDKRLLVLESEFASVLKVMGREKNTLSALLRQAWDKENLRTMTKNSPAASTGAHVSIVGHITRDELRRLVTDTDMANGVANRFLWFCARRSKFLPEGGQLGSVDFAPTLKRLSDAVAFARTVDRIERDDDARALWVDVYPKLSAERFGLLGAATSRAEPQTMRLAMLFALLDCSPQIRHEHLQAGLAVWRYADESARYVFGSALGDATADAILTLLRDHPEGVNRTMMRDHFQNHKAGDEIGRALLVLEESRLARREQQETGGRPAEVWHAVR